jgi:hypothetical protein
MKMTVPRPKHLGALVGAVVVAGVAIFGGMALADIDGNAKRSNSTASGSGPTATPTAEAASTSTPAPAPTSAPATQTPATAQTIPGLQNLPPNIRQQIENGVAITQEQINALVRQRSNAVAVGVITRLRGNELTLREADGDSYTTTITGKTSIRLGAQALKRNDLEVGDTVFVVSMDGGDTAFSISSFGALAAVR